MTSRTPSPVFVSLLTAKSVACALCPDLIRSSSKVVDSTTFGPGPFHLLIVGEAPGSDEDLLGEPWVGAAGKKLRWLLAEAGIRSYAMTNAVRHHPSGNRDPADHEITNCQMWLDLDLVLYSPRVVLCLGKIASKAVAQIGFSGTVIHAIHPAATLRNPRYHEKLWDRILEVGRLLDARPIKTRIVFPVVRPGPPPRAQLGPAWPQGPVVAADIETEGDENDGNMVGYSISDGRTKTWVETSTGPSTWPYAHTIMHGATFDAPSLGVDLFRDSWDCTLLEGYVLRYPELALKSVGNQGFGPRLVGIPMTAYSELMKESGVKKGHNFRKALEADYDRAVEYATTDSEATYHLHRILSGDPRWAEGKLRWRYDNLEKPVAAILSEMQETGVLIDVQALNDLHRKLESLAREHTDWLSVDLGEEINVKSPALGAILNARCNAALPLSDVGNVKAGSKELLAWVGADSWDGPGGLQERYQRDDLRSGDEETVYHILAAREARTLDATYCVGLPKRADSSGIIHAQWKQTTVLTNRLASGDPNLQNISARSELGKPIRRAFIVPPGFVWLRADFSQVEVRLFAHLTRDKALLACYPWGGVAQDVHNRVATALGIDRKPAKNGLFETIYGGSASKFARTVGVSAERAEEFHQNLLREFPSIATWAKVTEDMLLSQGYLETILGHRMYFPTAWSPVPSERAEALRSAANGRVQGSAADIMKRFMIEAYPVTKARGAWFLVQVHDELGIACPEEEAEGLKRDLEDIVTGIAGDELHLSVPLEISIGWAKNWKDAG